MPLIKSFNPSADVNTTTDTINIPSHGFGTLDGVIYRNGGGTTIGGLVHNTKYYIIVIDSDNIKLGSTEVNARNSIAVDLINAGAGSVHTLEFTTIYPKETAVHNIYQNIRLVGGNIVNPDGETIIAETADDTLNIVGGAGVSFTDINHDTKTFTLNATQYDFEVPIATTNLRLFSDSGDDQSIILTPARGISITRVGSQELEFESFGVTETDTLQSISERGNITNNKLIMDNLLVARIESTPGIDGVVNYNSTGTTGTAIALTGNGTLDNELLFSPDYATSTEAAKDVYVNFQSPAAQGTLSYTAVYTSESVLTTGSVMLQRNDGGGWVTIDNVSGTVVDQSYEINGNYAEILSSTVDYRLVFSWTGSSDIVTYRIRVTYEVENVPGTEIIMTDTVTEVLTLGTLGGTVNIRGAINLADEINTDQLTIYNNNIVALNSDTDINLEPAGVGAVQIRSNWLSTNQSYINVFTDSQVDEVYIGSTTSLTTINDNLRIVDDVEIQGGNLTTDQSTFNLLVDTNLTTLNIGNANTDINLGNIDINGNIIDTNDSTGITITPTVTTESDVTVGNDLFVTSESHLPQVIISNDLRLNTNEIHLGANSGEQTQDVDAIAIGRQAGRNFQGTRSVAIGLQAGEANQGNQSIAIGWQAGISNQGTQSIAIGQQTGAEGDVSVAIGFQAGNVGQSNDAISIGTRAGQTNQDSFGIAIGTDAGYSGQGNETVAIGRAAGGTSQGNDSVAVGAYSGNTTQGDYSVAVGRSAGSITQAASSVAVGYVAGNLNQGSGAVAVGAGAGNSTQSSGAVALGNSAGNLNQNANAVAIGWSAARDNQDAYAIAIGDHAGYDTQGQDAIAIGRNAGRVSQHANSIILNATGLNLNSDGTSRLYIDPVRENATDRLMFYNTTTKEVSYGSDIALTFSGSTIGTDDSSGVILDNDVTINNSLDIDTDLTVGQSFSVSGNAIISGSLTVNGTTTTVNTETINLADNKITLNSNETGTPSQDSGIEIERGTSANKTLIWNETTDKWTVGSETFVAGTFEGALNGNADTATALQTARNIGGVSFDGTANINLPGVNTSGNQDTSGNAATATALQNPRTIAGVTFDGTANIIISTTNLNDGIEIVRTSQTTKFGYGTGAGGAVLQPTNKTTAVTLNTLTGVITTSNASLAGSSIVQFTLNNSNITATDMFLIEHVSGGTQGSYAITAWPGAGSATITIRNLTVGALAQALDLRFMVLRSANS